MPTTKTIVKEINYYLNDLSQNQQQAVLTVVKTFAAEDNTWDEKKYLKEMNKRFAEMETGKVKVLSLDELELNARKSYKGRKKTAL
ncbi:MAG: hypothetical protein RIR12_1250 [Bacteroidota bacterium]|jgi:hypothetical protein